MKTLQAALGIAADGQFGPGTERAVRDYQQKNGLAVDGMAGPETLSRMRIFAEITAETVERSQVPAEMVALPETAARARRPPLRPAAASGRRSRATSAEAAGGTGPGPGRHGGGVQRIGREWVYRVAQEPGRMWKQQRQGNRAVLVTARGW